MRLSLQPAHVSGSALNRRSVRVLTHTSRTVSLLRPLLAGCSAAAHHLGPHSRAEDAASSAKAGQKHPCGTVCCSTASAAGLTAKPCSSSRSSPALVILSPTAKRCIRMAAAEAKLMGCKEVHPAHVLLACMRLGQEALDGKGCPAGAASEFHACMEYVNTLKSHGIKVDDASASFKAELDRHRHNDEDATHATVTWGDDCKELVRQALLTASRAGYPKAHPVHLLIALTDMAPLPTVLHNPLVWLLAKTKGRTSPATSVLFDVYKTLKAARKRARKASKQHQQADSYASFLVSWSDEEEEVEEGLNLIFAFTPNLPDWGPQDTPGMGLSRLAGLMEWCLDEDHIMVLTPAARQAIQARFTELEQQGTFEMLDPSAAKQDLRHVANKGSSHRWACTEAHVLSTRDWSHLVEGARQQGVTLPESLLRGLILRTPVRLSARSSDQQDETQLLSAIVWHVGSGGRDGAGSRYPQLVPWLVSDPEMQAAAHIALSRQFSDQLARHQHRSASSTAGSLAVLARHSSNAATVFEHAIATALSSLYPHDDPVASARKLNRQIWNGDADHCHSVQVLALASRLITSAPDSIRAVQMDHLLHLLPHLTATAAVVLLSRASSKAVCVKDIEGLTPHIAQGLLWPSKLVKILAALSKACKEEAQGGEGKEGTYSSTTTLTTSTGTTITSSSSSSNSSSKEVKYTIDSSFWEAWSKQVCRLGAKLKPGQAAELVEALADLAERGRLPADLLKGQQFFFDDAQPYAVVGFISIGGAVRYLASHHAEGKHIHDCLPLLAAASRLARCSRLDDGFRTAVGDIAAVRQYMSLSGHERYASVSSAASSRSPACSHAQTLSHDSEDEQEEQVVWGLPGDSDSDVEEEEEVREEEEEEEDTWKSSVPEAPAIVPAPLPAPAYLAALHHHHASQLMAAPTAAHYGIQPPSAPTRVAWAASPTGAPSPLSEFQEEYRWVASIVSQPSDVNIESVAKLLQHLKWFTELEGDFHNLANSVSAAEISWGGERKCQGDKPQHEHMLDLLVQCASLGVIPVPQVYGQLWAGLEPHLGSLSKVQQAEAVWAVSVLQQETSKLTLSKLCSSEPEGSSDSSTRTSSSKGVLSGERVQEYARLLSLLVKMHAPQDSGTPDLAPELQTWVASVCDQVAGADLEAEDRAALFLASLRVQLQRHPSLERLEALASCAVSLSQLCPSQGYQLAAQLFRALKLWGEDLPQPLCASLTWGAAFALRQYAGCLGQDSSSRNSQSLPTQAPPLPPMCSQSDLELTELPPWLTGLRTAPLIFTQKIEIMLSLLQALQMLEEVEAAAAYWAEPCPVPAGWRKYLWGAAYRLDDVLPSIDSVLERSSLKPAPESGTFVSNSFTASTQPAITETTGRLLDVCELATSLCTRGPARLEDPEIPGLLVHVLCILCTLEQMWGEDSATPPAAIPDPQQEARRQLLVSRVRGLLEACP